MAARLIRVGHKHLGHVKWKILGSTPIHISPIANTAIPISQITCRRFLSLHGGFLSQQIGRSSELVACPRDQFFRRILERDCSRLHLVRRLASASKDDKGGSRSGDIMETKEQPQTQLTVGAKVVQAGKDVTYLGIILVGFAVTGALLWYVFSELFLGFSPNKVYSDALKQVLANSEVVEELGDSIMGHGETTRRGRRRHVSFQEYIVDGEDYMRVKFYVKGSNRKGNVHVDVKKGARGNFTYRFIFVEFTDHPSHTIVILDNR